MWVWHMYINIWMNDSQNVKKNNTNSLMNKVGGVWALLFVHVTQFHEVCLLMD